MAETLIARTYAVGLRPLGAAAQRNHSILTEVVSSRLSPTHARMFAEPLPDPDGVATDWYAPIEGPVRRLDELGMEEAEEARARIGSLTRDVLELAGELEESNAEADRRLGDALRNAVEVPDIDSVWLVGDQPVLVTWAHSRDIDKAPRGVIRRFIPRPAPLPAEPAPAPPPVPVVERQGKWGLLWWLGWFVLAVLMFWTLYLLIAPCGVRGPEFLPFDLDMLDTCPRAESDLDPELDAEAARRAALENRIASLELDLARAGGACEPPPAVVEVPAEPVEVVPPEPVEEPSDAVQAVREEGGEIGTVNVILTWRDRSDLDLTVFCPAGQKIYYSNRTACGGTLDTDANVDVTTTRPVENVVFAESPQVGRYRVEVFLFSQKEAAGKARHPFTLTVIVDGEEMVHNASVSPDNKLWTTEFRYGGSR